MELLPPCPQLKEGRKSDGILADETSKIGLVGFDTS